MSRTRKFQLGDVAYWEKLIEGVKGIPSMPYFVVIVDYAQDGTGRGMYRVVRTTHPQSGATFGEPVWVGPHCLTPMDVPNRPTAVKVYRANEKLIDRGCSCTCCAHEAIPKGMIRADGSFVWDQIGEL
jgi:hypothetical protein